MWIRRLSSNAKLINKQMLMMTRREPYKPQMKERHEIKCRAQLNEFEQKCAAGIVFVPDEELPPWQKSLVTNMKRKNTAMNLRGFRVRVADSQDELGFPTHFR